MRLSLAFAILFADDDETPHGGQLTPPTQKAISASRPRWVTGGWSGAGERRSAGGAGGGGAVRGPARGGTAGGPCGGPGRGRAGVLGFSDPRVGGRGGRRARGGDARG